MGNTLLELKDLSIDYLVEGGYLSAVHQVSFSIGQGEFFALVGESGCGKSTVAHAIMRLSLDHTERYSGQIAFEGKNLTAMSERELEKLRGSEVGMIFQNPLDSLNPVYTVGYQVEEALVHNGMSKKEARARTIQLFKDVQITDAERRVDSFPHELSGGMRQRVMIAMMLAQRPKLLIADEPTTALDVTVEAQILEIMKDMRAKTGASILMITHNFGIVAEVADRVGIMYAGDLVECGTVYQIFEHPSHPYSQALLGALPRIRKTQGRISTIEGAVPRIVGECPGCRFANRCPYATEECRKAAPPRRMLADGHWMICHREG